MPHVSLQTGRGEIVRLRCGAALQEFAMRWSYIASQRHRWASDEEARLRHADRLRADLRKLGLPPGKLRRLTGVVQVTVPDSKADRYWEANILPWEYVLATASDPERGDAPILVVRHLNTHRRRRTRRPDQVAVVESAPGELAKHFDVSAGRELIVGGFSRRFDDSISLTCDPTADDLAAKLRRQSPDVIHLAAVDTRSGRRALGRTQRDARDGIWLSDGSGQAVECRAERVAERINAGSPNPLLISFGCWDSGSRLAPMAVRRGAAAAIGFQFLDDAAVAEAFFLNFYRTWAESDWNLLAAFRGGWNAVARYRRTMAGGGIVLWTAHSLLSNRDYERYRGWERRPRPESACRNIDDSPTAHPQRHRVTDLLRTSIRPKPTLNYSSLHNGGSVFDEFAIRLNPSHFLPAKDGLWRIDDVDVEVQLHVGADTFPYRSRWSFDAARHHYDLAGHRGAPESASGSTPPPIRLPLTGDLFRTISERIETSLFVEIRWHDQILYRQTHGIWIAPIDQWTLDDRQLGWLPSFVQPRDPAVARLTSEAATLLRCLCDHPDSGFDGYQSYDAAAPPSQRWRGVDDQVRAIWWAMRSGTPLRYINPPPSYADFSQRLRTPGDTLGGGFGTCVDLAIALTSCLEWIEIHPVLFLLHGHVFAGYWHDLTAHRRFRDVLTEDVPAAGSEKELTDGQRNRRWVSGADCYREIKGFVDRGELIPLETVGLTQGKGFRHAIADGRGHFDQPRNRSFRAMIDLVTARENNGVTPLPIVVQHDNPPINSAVNR